MARPKKIKEVKTETQVTLKITRRYHDTVLDKLIEVGTELNCTKERAKQLIDAKVAEVVAIKK